jgi:FixJ family two-component response regulator
MIFIIDDDPSVRNALLLLLQNVGFEARAFPSAEDFYKHALINNHDCIILGLRMPEMNGFDLMETLISEGIHTPVICLTAFDDVKNRERARELGAVAYCTKPVDDQALIDAIKWAIISERRQRLEAEGKINPANNESGQRLE